MKNRRCVIAQCVLPGLLLTSFLNGCSALQRHSRTGSRDHAFIVYWPPAENSKQLRLAVKDLIDMKGVVTTAGSEYVATTSPPASREAQCLELARERNAQIRGKTNHTEFAGPVVARTKYLEPPGTARMANTNLFQEVRQAVRRWLSKLEWPTLLLERIRRGPFAFPPLVAAFTGLKKPLSPLPS